MRLELLKGANGLCVSLDSTRITEPKIYGTLAPIMVWEVPAERIQQILDEREPARHGDGGHETRLEKLSREIAGKLLAAYPNGAEFTAVQHGRWVRFGAEDADGNVCARCSACGAMDSHAKGVLVPYCWKCGARMDDETEGEQE